MPLRAGAFVVSLGVLARLGEVLVKGRAAENANAVIWGFVS